MDQHAANSGSTAVFGEPAYATVDTCENDRSIPDQGSPASSATSEPGVSELISKYPLLAVSAAGAVAFLAVMAMRKGSAAETGTQQQLARYTRLIEKAARREYRKTDLGNRIATLSRSLGGPEASQFIMQALEQLQRAVAAKKR